MTCVGGVVGVACVGWAVGCIVLGPRVDLNAHERRSWNQVAGHEEECKD